MKFITLFSLLVLTFCVSACSSHPPDSTERSFVAQPHIERVPGTNIVIWPQFISSAKAHYTKRVVEIAAQPPFEGTALFLGDSITEGFPTTKLFPTTTANYGIGWDTSPGLGERLEQVTRTQPDRIFLMIGTNDLAYKRGPGDIVMSTLAIIDVIHAALPTTEIYVQSILPREASANTLLDKVNVELGAKATEEPYIFLDLASHFAAEDGTLHPDYTTDGLHLNMAGNTLWARLIQKCVLQGCDDL